jgi:hypothetical protein
VVVLEAPVKTRVLGAEPNDFVGENFVEVVGATFVTGTAGAALIDLGEGFIDGHG